MNVGRNEIRTGILVVLTLTILAAVLVYLGAPGVITPQKDFSIYFDNAAGLQKGTQVMLAGRKVGQVVEIVSPVAVSERPAPPNEKDPPLEVRVKVRVDRSAQIYRLVKVRLASYGVMDEAVIDFTGGEETSGLAEEGMHFVGERPGGLADAGTASIEKIETTVTQLVSKLKKFDATAANAAQTTESEADLAKKLAKFRETVKNLSQMTGRVGPISRAVAVIERQTAEDGELSTAVADFRKSIAPDSEVAKALANAEKFTAQLANQNDVPATLNNFKSASARLNTAITGLQADLGGGAKNLQQETDTLKREPWRLLRSSTKKSPEGAPKKTAEKPRKRPLFRTTTRIREG